MPQILRTEILISPSGAVFVEDDSIILAGPGSSKMIMHLALTLPQIIISEDTPCKDEFVGKQARQLAEFDRKTRSWFIQLLENNFNSKISVPILNKLVSEHTALVSREKRTFTYVSDGYFLLSSWTENKFDASYTYNTNMFTNIKGSLSNLKVRITKNSQLLKSMAELVCRENRRVDIEEKLNSIKLTYLDFVKSLSTQINEAQLGFMPTLIDYNILLDLCRKAVQQHPDSQICKLINLRQFFQIRFNKLLMDKTRSALVLEIQIKLPKFPTERYKGYRVHTVPLFRKNNTVELQSNVQTIGVSESGNVVAFTNCVDKSQIYYCTHQLGVSVSQCHAQLFFDTNFINQNYCLFRVIRTNMTCFVKRIEQGLIISSKNNIQIHEITLESNIFKNKGKDIKHIFLLRNNEIVKSVRCNGRDYHTELSHSAPVINVTVHNNYSVNNDHDNINKRVNHLLAELDNNMGYQQIQHESLKDHVRDIVSFSVPVLILFSLLTII